MKTRNYYLIIIVLIIAVSASLLIYGQYKKNASPAPKPEITERDNEEDYKWYVCFTAREQKTTAYTEEANAPRPANGGSYFPGGIAVHPRYPVQSGGDPLQPILPFGTKIHLMEPIKVQGQEYRSLTVIDTGDVNYGLWSAYPYWFDVYFGTNNYYNNKDANDYGVPLKSYYWYEEWK
jgi:hypothetical protein